jgi:hypothetical protein
MFVGRPTNIYQFRVFLPTGLEGIDEPDAGASEAGHVPGREREVVCERGRRQ